MNAIVPINNPAPAYSVGDVERVANAIAKGGLFGSKDPYAVLTLCLLAQAEGQHPAVVFRDYHIIQGKPAKKADAMLRDFVNAGGKVEWHKLDDAVADATFSHPGGGTVRIDWTMERAQQAGLATAMWKKYPRQMLRARVISEGVRTVYPGATSGLYVPEEVSSFGDDAVNQPHASPRSEIIDHEATQPNEPAPRTKLDGPHTSKTALRKAIVDIIAKVRAAESELELTNIQKENIATIKQANVDWPALLTGDPHIEEDVGLKGAIERRREELSKDDGQLKVMIESMKGCDTLPALTHWMTANEAAIDTLDDADRRTFEAAYETHEAGILAMDRVTAGA